MSMGALGPEFYDAVYSRSPGYRGPPEESLYFPLWKVILDCLEPGWRILDVGCGPGQFARLCVDAGHSYVGLDFSEEAIKLGRARVPEAEFQQVDVEIDRFRIRSGDYNVATFVEFLEHVEDDIGILGAVPPGKNVVFSVPSYEGIEHVRSFPSIESVTSRYGFLLRITKYGKLARGKEDRVYVIAGIRVP